jgi:uncharacterized protein
VAQAVIVDTGPLVALLCAGERRHAWAVERFAGLTPPLLTCEAVLAEADHLVRRTGNKSGGLVLELVQRGVLRVAMALGEEAVPIARIQSKYRSLGASLADACLVRMSELYDESIVMTLDNDFRIYRRHGRRVIPLLAPSE